MDCHDSRRATLRAMAGGSLAAMAGCSGDSNGDGGSPSGTPPVDSVGLETVATGFQAPVDVTFVPDADRRYVADQSGQIFVHEGDGLREEPLLDLRDGLEFGGEKGLLGIALHPNFADTRRLFVRYSSPARAGTPGGYSHTFVLAEFEVSADGRRADPASERPILELPQPQANHNAGSLAFGPDGFLYVGTGDGGAGGDRGDGHVDDWYDANAGGNGQDVTENLLGSLLRIDVDGTDTVRGEERNYAVPADNPLVGEPGLDEHYAWGLRNPWRFAFDDEDLFVGDVGQNAWEEIDLVERGGNYGWNVREGGHCYGADDCPDTTPEGVRGGEPLLDPIVEYPHGGGGVSGVSVIGGEVYRGSEFSALEGTYVFGDLQASGRLFTASRPDDGGYWPTAVLSVRDGDADRLEQLRSFGRDADGEVYVLATGSEGGGLYRIGPA